MIVHPRARRLLPAAVLLAAACAPAAAPPAPPPAPAATAAPAEATTAGYVVRIGRDTVAVESVTRSPVRVEGVLVSRTPRTMVYRYAADLHPDGRFARAEVGVHRPGEAAALRSATAEFGRDSARVVVELGDSTIRQRVALGAAAVPAFGNSFGIYEQVARLARSAGGDSAVFAVVPFGAPEAYPLTVREAGGDTLVFEDMAGTSLARVGSGGALLAWDGTRSTDKITAERVPALDVEALAAAFAARDDAGRPMGALSPRDSVRATVAGARVEVDYGRPARRGRKIMGEVVPWNQVWRTGANAATTLRTDRALEIGGVLVPAGTYTLFTLPSPHGWKLIVNRQTGQWGTEYDAARDLARIEMRTETLTEPVEQFTIAVEPRDGGGVLSLAWDDTRAWVPFTVR